jgi:hypothetical protein
MVSFLSSFTQVSKVRMVTFHRSQHVLTMDIPEEFARSASRFADQLSHTLTPLNPSLSIPLLVSATSVWSSLLEAAGEGKLG